jgi:hypothetical protein
MLMKVGPAVFGAALIGATVTAAVVPSFEAARLQVEPVTEYLQEGDVVLVRPFAGEDKKKAAAVGTAVRQNLALLLGDKRVVEPAKMPGPKDPQPQVPPKDPAHTHVLGGALDTQLTLSLATTAGEPVTQMSATWEADWSAFTMMWIVWCVLAAIGLGIWRVGVLRASRQSLVSGAHSGDNPFTLLEDLQKPLAALGEELAALNEQATCDRVDELLETYVLPFAEVRRKIIDRLGMGKGSEILIVVAYGERMLNRVWSAASDGHLPEARSSFPEAKGAFHKAQQLATEALETVKTGTGGDATSTSVPAT